MIKPTTDTKRLQEAFYQVFKSRDPFTPAGQVDMPVRIILYPTYGYHLEATQFKALAGALRDLGEQEFFISLIEPEPDPFNWDSDMDSHWVCKEPSFTEYMELPLILENAIYSSSGMWGFLVSHEDHALMVCRPSFWNAFQKQYPRWKKDQEEFVKNWHRNEMEMGIDVRWLKPFLTHLTQSPEQ